MGKESVQTWGKLLNVSSSYGTCPPLYRKCTTPMYDAMQVNLCKHIYLMEAYFHVLHVYFNACNFLIDAPIYKCLTGNIAYMVI